jgi:hypothetical protein
LSRHFGDRAGLSVETAKLSFLWAAGAALEYRRGPAGQIIKRSIPNARECAIRRVPVGDVVSFAAALLDAEQQRDEGLYSRLPRAAW